MLTNIHNEVFEIKFHSKFFIFIILIIFLSSISFVSAEDSVNETVDEVSEIEIGEIERYADGSLKDFVGDATDDDLADLSECSSVVLQVSATESVISFRRDSTEAADITVESGNWGDIEYLKQYKTSGGYFAHAIVTSNGWLIGNGGVTDGSVYRQIESIASEMVVKDVISNDYLSRIYNILSRYSLGHFVIKAPDGTYGVVFTDRYHVSNLNPGQYIICPNIYSYSKKGTYDSSLNPVDAAIKLVYTDSYGVNRRNVMTYNYKPVSSDTGVSFGVECYASNDNGAGVGRSTASLADNIYFYGKYFSRSSLPVTPNKIYMGTHAFAGTSIEIFKLLSPVATSLVGESVELKYQVNYVAHSSPVVRFAVPEGFEFNSATLSKGTYTYDVGPRVVTWYLNDCEQNNFITLNIKAVKSGKYVMASSLNNNYVYEFELNVNKYGAKLSADNLEKYYKGPERLNVLLKDPDNNPIAGENVVININGVGYTRTTNGDGVASIAINLNSGEYDITASYNGRFGSDSTVAHVKVLKTISGNDIVKYYRNGTQYYARFIDTAGNPLANSDVSFNINGVFYTRTTDGNGNARLNINLNPGEYILTAINPVNGEQYSNNVKVLTILEDGHDLTKYYRNDSVYSIKVLDDTGNPLVNGEVRFNINGVFYTRMTNESGYANLNIRLQPGEYIVTAEYNQLMYTNIVTVLPTLFANDTVSYTNESNFACLLIDGNGNPYANQTITFNIGGVVFTNVTGEDGIADLLIYLPDGEYSVTSSYDEYNINNRITIRSS